ncbi:MAG: PD-(D/E)XK nuclease family protein [Nitrososphaerota archaeon]
MMSDILLIDNTRYEVLVTCPTKYYYRYVLGYSTPRPHISLVFGRAVHKGIESWYRSGNKNLALSTTIESFNEVEYVADDKDPRDKKLAVEAVSGYIDKYNEDKMRTLETNGHKWLESTFCVPIGTVDNYQILYYGVFDRIALLDGRPLVVDYKTTSVLGPSYFDQFKPNNQVSMYQYAAGELLGTPVDMVCIDAIGITKSNIRFERRIITYSRDQILESVKDILDTVRYEMIVYKESGVYPKRKVSCISKYGKCQFYDVCSRPHQVRSNFLDTYFIREDADAKYKGYANSI